MQWFVLFMTNLSLDEQINWATLGNRRLKHVTGDMIAK